MEVDKAQTGQVSEAQCRMLCLTDRNVYLTVSLLGSVISFCAKTKVREAK